MSDEKVEKSVKRRVMVVEKKHVDASSVSKDVLEKTLSSLQARANSGTLDFDEVRSLCSTVEALIKLSKEERENAEQYSKLSDEELIKKAQEAIELLNKKQ